MSPRRVVVVIVMVCFLALALANPVRTYFTQRQDVAEAAAHHDELVAQIAELEKKEKLLEDPDYLRAQARDRLGFVEAGRTPYIVELPGDPVEAQEQHDKAVAQARPWYGSVWDSVSHAADDSDVPVPNVIPAPAPPPGG
ncbi:FtsB family cell division protein [Tomitella fengzijianii]|uniref:Septum formation initiator family protein n=1 Tax=Tomitella fengzijianii TaxID=2597660 RepID=A0A516X214_9ACTN|nr:septum formation initiator family protein [Tomitella fengzijianii]QDQ97093.1 septum formation initiator family protein [Tomitella fengzijianii]